MVNVIAMHWVFQHREQKIRSHIYATGDDPKNTRRINKRL